MSSSSSLLCSSKQFISSSIHVCHKGMLHALHCVFIPIVLLYMYECVLSTLCVCYAWVSYLYMTTYAVCIGVKGYDCAWVLSALMYMYYSMTISMCYICMHVHCRSVHVHLRSVCATNCAYYFYLFLVYECTRCVCVCGWVCLQYVDECNVLSVCYLFMSTRFVLTCVYMCLWVCGVCTLLVAGM